MQLYFIYCCNKAWGIDDYRYCNFLLKVIYDIHSPICPHQITNLYIHDIYNIWLIFINHLLNPVLMGLKKCTYFRNLMEFRFLSFEKVPIIFLIKESFLQSEKRKRSVCACKMPFSWEGSIVSSSVYEPY